MNRRVRLVDLTELLLLAPLAVYVAFVTAPLWQGF